MDNLDARFRELISRHTSEENAKHQEHQNSLKTGLADVLNVMRKELKHVSEETTVKCENMRGTSAEINVLREKISELSVAHESIFERAQHFTRNSVQELASEIMSDRAMRMEEMQADRVQTESEINDICSAVKSLQAWVSDVETTITERNDARNKDLKLVDVRFSEMREVGFDAEFSNSSTPSLCLPVRLFAHSTPLKLGSS